MIKGILFDKDGTLIEFYSMWLLAAIWVVPRLMERNDLRDTKEITICILEAMGIVDGVLLPDGALSYKVYEDIAIDICNALQGKGIQAESKQVTLQLAELFQECLLQNQGTIKPLCNLKTLIVNLKRERYAIGLATADTMISARECLKRLDIYSLFDYIGADDGEKIPKPHPHMFLEFQEQCSLKPSEIAVVGDTYNDMLFGKENGGVAIGVLSGVCKKDDFCDKADYILPSVNELEPLLEQLKEQG